MEIVDRLPLSDEPGSPARSAASEPRSRPASPSKLAPDTGWPLLDQVAAPVLVLDHNGIVLHLNSPAERRLGHAAAEIAGQDLFREVLPGLEAEGLGERFRAAMQGAGAVLSWETSLPRRDGAPESVGLAVRPARVQEQLVALVTLLEPGTLASFDSVHRQQMEHLAVVGELTRGVAHQINNPLASIKGFAQLLACDLADSTHASSLEIIEKECARITDIVDNLLRFARTEQVGQRRVVDLNELVERTLALQEYALTTAGIAVERDLAPDLPPTRVEPLALQRALLALLGHAERALNQQPEARRLTIRTRESTRGIMVSVQDNGPGLPREELLHLFQDGHDAPAAGCLSLQEAARIVARNDGEIWAEAAPGLGTTVHLRLAREAPAPVRLSLEKREPEVEEKRAGRRRLRVLVADDEPTLQLALAHYLARFGHQVTPATDVASALRMAAEHPFDVVLVDVRMPGDGRVLLQELEGTPALRGRTILMSGDPHQSRGGIVASERPFLSKPFDLAEALSLIEEVGR